jgi:hypothetical protein
MRSCCCRSSLRKLSAVRNAAVSPVLLLCADRVRFEWTLLGSGDRTLLLVLGVLVSGLLLLLASLRVSEAQGCFPATRIACSCCCCCLCCCWRRGRSSDQNVANRPVAGCIAAAAGAKCTGALLLLLMFGTVKVLHGAAVHKNGQVLAKEQNHARHAAVAAIWSYHKAGGNIQHFCDKIHTPKQTQLDVNCSKAQCIPLRSHRSF